MSDYNGFWGGPEYDNGFQDETDIPGSDMTADSGDETDIPGSGIKRTYPFNPSIRCHILGLPKIRYNQEKCYNKENPDGCSDLQEAGKGGLVPHCEISTSCFVMFKKNLKRR